MFRDRLTPTIGGEEFELRHARGETDDATWGWAPRRRVIAAGDLVTGYLPNAGNPRKVQRFVEEWADAVDEMAALAPEVIIPGHGDLVTGAAAIREELTAMATLLRHIVRHTLDGLNAGALPEEIVATLRLAGGVDALVARARELAEHDLPLPGHLAAWAFLADRDDGASRQCYVEVFERRAAADPSLMAQVNFLVSRAWVERARTVATE